MPILYLFQQTYRVGLSSWIQKEVVTSEYGSEWSPWVSPDRYQFKASISLGNAILDTRRKPSTIFEAFLTPDAGSAIPTSAHQIFYKDGQTVLECRKFDDLNRLGVLLIADARDHANYVRETNEGPRLGFFFNAKFKMRFSQDLNKAWLSDDRMTQVLCSPLTSLSQFTRQIDYLAKLLLSHDEDTSSLPQQATYRQLRALWSGETLVQQVEEAPSADPVQQENVLEDSILELRDQAAEHILDLYSKGHISVDKSTYRWRWHEIGQEEHKKHGAKVSLTKPQEKVVSAMCKPQPGYHILHA